MAIATARKPSHSATARVDCVFIRKSTQAQDEAGQIANVRTMLRGERVEVHDANWFIGTVSRRKLRTNAEFNRLLDLIENDRVGTVYVESQDRWGTKDRVELFTLLGILREHNTRLYDLRARKDLTEHDFATELLAVLNSYKSEKELQDLSYRSLRTRVNLFKESGTWPTGVHPFGYGKRCYSQSGDLLWEWQPHSRTEGRLYLPDPKRRGKLMEGPIQRIPAKTKKAHERTVLVPSSNKKYVESIRLLFELFTKVGLSRRQISARLNEGGHTYYDKPYSFNLVADILKNPAYVGDTHFGRTQQAELNTFDGDGAMVEVKQKAVQRVRPAGLRLIKENTHQGLIDRKTWKLAEDRIKGEGKRKQFAPRRPEFYLRPIFVCGHCGKNMAGKFDSPDRHGNRKVVYVCSSYVARKSNGLPMTCGYYSISHVAAEKMLLDKIKEMGLEHDAKRSELARTSLEERLARLGHADDDAQKQWQQYVTDGVTAFVRYMEEQHEWYATTDGNRKARKSAADYYWHDLDELSARRIKLKDVKALRTAIQKAEDATVQRAQKMLAKLQAEFKTLTVAWAKATDMQQGVLKDELGTLESQIREWQQRATPLSKRFDALYAAESEREIERKQLIKDWPSFDAREKGEAMRRLFKTVTLYWDTQFAANKKPAAKRKTKRPGRNKYTLKTSEIRWEFSEVSMKSPS
jgi:hypothetical protein